MPTAAEVKALLGSGGAPTGGGSKAPNPLAARLKKELESAEGTTSRLKERIKESKEAAVRTGMEVMHDGEALVALGVGSIAEGRWGAKMKLGGKVDYRLMVGIPLKLVGLYLTATGSGHAGHFQAASNGLLGSWAASVGREIGEAWRDKALAPPAAAATGTPSTKGDDDGVDLSGLRKIAMTDSGLDRPSPVAGDRHNRFREAEALR